MKDYPVLFNAPMVRAIHAGIKTQTRRPVVPQPPEEFYQTKCDWYHPTVVDRHGIEQLGAKVFGFADENRGWKSPFGGPGDRIRVRECWKPSLTKYHDTGNPDDHGGPNDPCCGYRATMTYGCGKPVPPPSSNHSWRSSQCMPRKYVRTFLPVIDVRVERIQDITTADCVAEGMEDDHWLEYEDMASSTGGSGVRETIRDYFGQKWDAIYATKGLGWDDNPLVWVGTFEGMKT